MVIDGVFGQKLAKYKLRVTKTFERNLRAFDIQKRRIDSTIRMLETDPCRENVYEHLAGKWSFRIGDYRIIYMVNEDEKTIILFDAEHKERQFTNKVKQEYQMQRSKLEQS